MLTLHTPADGTWDASDFAYNRWFVIHSALLGVHLFREVALVRRLKYARVRLIDSLFELLLKTRLSLLTQLHSRSARLVPPLMVCLGLRIPTCNNG